MMTIYGFNTFNAVKVLLTAEELGYDYTYVNLDLSKGEQKSPEHLRRHPFGKIPVLEHNGNTFFESNAICRYLANSKQQQMYSSDPIVAARIDQTIDVMTHHVGKWLGVYFWQEIICRKFFNKGPDAAAIEEARGFLEEQLPYIDGLLENSPFLCGDSISIADTVAYAFFETQELTSVTTDQYPNISRWYKAFAKRPSVAKMKTLLSDW